MDKKKVLVVVDVQNDFVKGGALAYGYPVESNTEDICAYAKKVLEAGHYVVATRDTHADNYLETLEGKMLPVKHCICGTRGWELVDGLQKLTYTANFPSVINKHTFGSFNLKDRLERLEFFNSDIDSIELCGYCTSICVTACAVILRAAFPDKRITVLQNLCGDIDEESHLAALKVLKNQQIEIADGLQ